MDEEQKKINVSRLLAFSYHYLSYRARTKTEMEQFLQKKAEQYGFTADSIESALSILETKGHINDKSYIESYIFFRSLNKQKGEYALVTELIQKGIPRKLIDEYFENNPIDENSLAGLALRKIWYRISGLPTLERTKKASDFLCLLHNNTFLCTWCSSFLGRRGGCLNNCLFFRLKSRDFWNKD